MDLVKNKASKKYFIVLDDTEDVDFLLITPEGKVRRLEQRLFTPLDTVDPKKPPWRQRLTERQLKKYKEYIDE